MSAVEPLGRSRRDAPASAIDAHLRRLAPLVLSKLRTVLEQRDQLEISTKTAAYDIVTDADRSIESWLWEETHRALPEAGFLGEEAGWRLGPTGGTDWVVDPIDGTVNFANGLPWACCSIAALVGGAASGGLIVDPFRADTYLTSSRSGGSSLNGTTVEVAPGDDFAGKVVLLEVPSGTRPSALRGIEDAVFSEDGAARSMGSGALALAMVAAGAVLAVVHLHPNIWDIAAGVALVEHAGGTVVGSEGTYTLGEAGWLVAGNASVCERLRPLLEQNIRGQSS